LRKFLVFLLFPSFIFPQVFGKNKVRYKNFTWEVIETEHFEIYYSPKIEGLANLSAIFAENAYKRLSNSLKMDVKNKIPLILFSSHYDFQQTNIILELIDKGVGGFSEVFKKRIAIPFTGSYKELNMVINHELTHIFCYELLYGNIFERLITNQILPNPPMWFMEGLASYYEGEFTAVGEMVLKDAVLENSLIPLYNLSDFTERPYLAYQESHSLISYIAEKYGEEALAMMLRKFSANIPQDKAIKNVLGISQDTLFEKWVNSLKEKYWPIVKERKSPGGHGKKIFQGGSFPSISPAGDIIALIWKEQNRLLLVKSEDGKIVKKIKKPGVLEELNPVSPSWSPDGCNIGFVGRCEKNDAIFIYSIIKEKITDKIDIEGLDSVKSLSFSPDSTKMAISGYKDGKGRLFILSLSKKELLEETGKIDSFPLWLSDDKILFLREENGSFSVWTLDIKEKKQERVLSLSDIIYLSSVDKDRFILIADDIYLCDLSEKKFAPLTSLTTGALSASFNPIKKRLVFSSYNQGEEDIYIMDVNENTLVWKPFPTSPPIFKEKMEVKKIKREYSKKFTIDYRKGDLLYDSRQGLVANMQIAGSDILGNNRLVVATNYNSGILDFSNLFVSYLFLSKRPSIGIGLFRENVPYFGKNEEFIDSEGGLTGYIDYPFSKTRRIELEGVFEKWERGYILPSNKEDKKAGIYLLRPSIVEDTSDWGFFGPFSGRRIRLTYEKALNPTKSKDILEFDNIKTDIRKYIRLTKNVVLAGRLFYEESNGRDKREFPLGGVSILPIRWDAILRGYDYDEFWGNRILSGNIEIRIPFIERLDFALGLSIKGIRSVVFYDFGAFWINDKKQEGLSGTGIGFRVNLGALPIRLDYGWPKGVNKAKAHFSLGYDF